MLDNMAFKMFNILLGDNIFGIPKGNEFVDNYSWELIFSENDEEFF
jgi:hypothetical protein